MENTLNRTHYPTQSDKVLSSHHPVGCWQIDSENKIDQVPLSVDNCSAFKLTLFLKQLKGTSGSTLHARVWK